MSELEEKMKATYGSSKSAIKTGDEDAMPFPYMSDETHSGTSVLFTLKDRPGALAQILKVFEDKGINLQSIKSRPSHSNDYDWEFTLDVSLGSDNPILKETLKLLEESKFCPMIRVLGDTNIPWFPRKIQDLDKLSQITLACGEELTADHPGFNDEEYRRRRQEITEMSKSNRFGSAIPRVEYTDVEVETWGKVYRSLKNLYSTHACRAHNRVFPLLEQFCGYSENNIPQLQDVSAFLQQATGWRLKPVTGLLTPRDFLNGLAFRVFHSTQYIRHHSVPFYTPEPDVCHELLGHAPLFADPDFAELSQEIGLASLGASDEEIEKLATLYWFTVEFGVCRENGAMKAYGAGLLSSFGELEYCVTDKPAHREFNPFVTCTTEYPITKYQPVYFVAESFEDASRALREYAASLKRPFSVRYNALTMTVEVLDSPEAIAKQMKRLQRDLGNLANALEKINAREEA
mmetsp:Transcript_34456/g.97168  ORF Transcript_34456/g.97168 Transcript_34456/m.97168 type:complete len:461 (+) Transcript_34456:285-1667(+)|eukprot:CAMPEP_0119129460 /NCGR_PEP_ID=MMETSP1310-20130426/7195_1 /TAXON_ID=464262 /ORGANISM="Genus nov. species nov., Strain RCC2339" /LENGTH=460 /DNA_ID=CAMNT_0007119879 /DNA_START=231 /DNA_END=1613 /DNA_ORIENTATION=+